MLWHVFSPSFWTPVQAVQGSSVAAGRCIRRKFQKLKIQRVRAWSERCLRLFKWLQKDSRCFCFFHKDRQQTLVWLAELLLGWRMCVWFLAQLWALDPKVGIVSNLSWIVILKFQGSALFQTAGTNKKRQGRKTTEMASHGRSVHVFKDTCESTTM